MGQRTVIKPSHSGFRLDKYLSEYDGGISRSRWKKLIKDGHVKVNSQTARARQLLAAGDRVDINFPAKEKKPIDIPVIKRTDKYIAINKPPGVLSHARNNFETEYTVADFAAENSKHLAKDSSRQGIVHRLDRLTSGVMILALDSDTLEYLSAQFAGRKVEKLYVAVVKGKLKPSAFMIDAPIGRSNKNPKLFIADQQGRAAKTIVKAIKYLDNEKLSVVLLRPLSGRTHQLRVHMKLIGHVIAGDSLYGAKGRKFPRTMLHSYKLRISTEPGAAPATFVAKLPPDMSLYINDEELKGAADAFGDETGN